jgi:hypothetical protein
MVWSTYPGYHVALEFRREIPHRDRRIRQENEEQGPIVSGRERHHVPEVAVGQTPTEVR